MDNRRISTFKDLMVWQMSQEMVLSTYEVTKKFPKREQDNLAQQMREMAAEIPLNIALGFKKRGRATKTHYYRTALTMTEKLQYFYVLACDLGFYKESEEITEELEQIEKKLKGLLRSVSSSK